MQIINISSKEPKKHIQTNSHEMWRMETLRNNKLFNSKVLSKRANFDDFTKDPKHLTGGIYKKIKNINLGESQIYIFNQR